MALQNKDMQFNRQGLDCQTNYSDPKTIASTRTPFQFRNCIKKGIKLSRSLIINLPVAIGSTWFINRYTGHLHSCHSFQLFWNKNYGSFCCHHLCPSDVLIYKYNNVDVFITIIIIHNFITNVSKEWNTQLSIIYHFHFYLYMSFM